MEKNYVTYDYKTINVKAANKYRILDMVKAFGYLVVETKDQYNQITITLKREANISYKDELDKLFDLALDKVNKLERTNSKTKSITTTVGLTIGIIGALTFGGGMSLFMVNDNKIIWHYVVGVILGLIGILIMIINDFITKGVREKALNKYNPESLKLNEEINKICEEANNIIIKSVE